MTLAICSLLMSAALTPHHVTRLLILMPMPCQQFFKGFLRRGSRYTEERVKEVKESQKERAGIRRSLQQKLSNSSVITKVSRQN
jgi:hypothetical protein